MLPVKAFHASDAFRSLCSTIMIRHNSCCIACMGLMAAFCCLFTSPAHLLFEVLWCFVLLQLGMRPAVRWTATQQTQASAAFHMWDCKPYATAQPAPLHHVPFATPACLNTHPMLCPYFPLLQLARPDPLHKPTHCKPCSTASPLALARQHPHLCLTPCCPPACSF